MKRRQLFLTLLFLLIAALFQMQAAFETHAMSVGKITFKAVDESGLPVEGTEVAVGFFVGGVKKVKAVHGFTDASGHFTATSEVQYRVSVSLKKQDYYKSRMDYTFKRPINGKYQPWNPTIEIEMRRIEKPVPMYARNTRRSSLEIPVAGKKIGFDLIEYDWVSPYGKGKITDLEFQSDKIFINQRDFDAKVTITFPSKFDGIQLVNKNIQYGSEFKLPRYAPEVGYQPELIKTKTRKPKDAIKDNYEEDNNYIFRIRSEEEDGKLVKAMYGKIQGDFELAVIRSKTAKVFFKYYLNPDYTRNLEYDSKQNLFGNLPRREQVGLK